MLFLFISLICVTISLCANEPSNETVQQPWFGRSVIFAPWRDTYSAKASKNEHSNSPITELNCPFCLEIKSHDDEKHLILKRGRYCIIMLNPFPYAKGHILIVPYEHKSDLDDFAPEVRAEMIEFANITFSILKELYHFSGANVGFNIGRCAGASIPEHLHMQLIPRRYHEVSFLHLIANTSLGFNLPKMYQEIKPYFDVT